jgi:tetratricopeptide (TPR) repeat protein
VQLGSTPHPGMALVRLSQGDVRGAVASIAVALADETCDCLARARLLPAQVEIALADGDVETARSAAAELSTIATRYARPALAAAAECAQASVLLAEGAPAMAAASLQRGIALWREAGAPYETARARLLLGEALERQGDRKHALVEFDAARESFDALGAELDLERAARLLASALRADAEVAGSGSTSPATVTGSPGRPGAALLRAGRPTGQTGAVSWQAVGTDLRRRRSAQLVEL